MIDMTITAYDKNGNRVISDTFYQSFSEVTFTGGAETIEFTGSLSSKLLEVTSALELNARN
jgi:hypothetical protein